MFLTKSTLFNKHSVLWILGLCLLVHYLFLIVQIVKFAPVNPDAGYYLSLARDMNQGMVLYRDIKAHYTPLAISLFFLAGHLSSTEPDYKIYLSEVLIFEIFSCLLTYFILRTLRISKLTSFLSSLFLGFYLLSYQGGFIELEPFALVFALCALLISLRRSTHPLVIALCGATASLSFLCKQYGITAILAPTTAYLISNNCLLNKARHLSILLVGWLIPIVLSVAYYALSYDVPLAVLAQDIRRSGLSFVLNEPENLVMGAIEMSPALLLILYAGFKRTIRSDRNFLILLVGVVAFLPQFFVRQSLHYFILIIPFVVLLTIYVLEKVRGNLSHFHYFALCTLLIVIATSHSINVHRGITSYGEGEQRRAQYLKANDINKVVTKGSKALVIGDPNLMYLSELRAAAPLTFGYDYPGLHRHQIIEEFLDQTPIVIVDEHDEVFYRAVELRFKEINSSLSEKLTEKGFKRHESSSQSRVAIWQKD